MQQSKLVQQLLLLHEEEHDRFRRFIESELFPTKRGKDGVIKLHSYFLQCRADLTLMNRSDAFLYIYSQKKVNEKTVQKLCGDLLKQLHYFFSICHCLDNEIERELRKVEVMLERKAYDYLPAEFKKAEKLLQKQPLRDTRYYHYIFRLSALKSRFENVYEGIFNYDLINDLDRYFLMEKIAYICGDRSNNNLNGDPTTSQLAPRPSFPDETINFKTWDAALKLLIDYKTDQSSYDFVKSSIFEQPKAFSHNDLYNLCSFLQNSALHLYANRHEQYLELFELYNFQREQGIYDSFNFNRVAFLNITTAAIYLSQIGWLKSLIEEYKENIATFEPGDLEIALAKIAVATADLSDVDAHIDVAKSSTDGMVKAMTYPIQIKAGFHNSNYQMGSSSCKAYLAFFNRLTQSSNLSEQVLQLIEQQRNFINSAEKILLMADSGARYERLAEIEKLERKMFLAADHIAEQSWVQQAMETILFNKIGNQLADRRQQLKDNYTLAKAKAFEQWLNSSASRMTPFQLESNKNFIRLFSETEGLRHEVCYTIALAERPYWLKRLSDPIKRL
ncbi:MAG: hypothetical protein AAGI23_14560 [Bacteroidota bacterium]